jgi:Uma2 family endonuclease
MGMAPHQHLKVFMKTATAPQQSVDTLLLDVTNARLKVTPEHFDQLCIDNPDLRLELTKDGEL